MKKDILFASLLLLPLFSCNNDDVVLENGSGDVGVELVVNAVMGNDNNTTKTAVQSNGTDIYWTSGDAINLFYGDISSGQFTTSITSPAPTATFSGTISAVTGSNEIGDGARSFWGVYPYNESNTCDGSGVTLTIPREQSGVAGTFADKLNPTIATSPGLDLVFYNVGSWLIFTVSRNDIVSATLRGNNSENLSGTVRVTMNSSSRPEVSEVINGISSVTMTPADSACFRVGKKYYMVLIPQTLSDGYSLTLTTSAGFDASCVVAGPKEFERSKFRFKSNADYGLSFSLGEAVDLGLSVKWATYNVGATKPEEYGDYYAFGETESKAEYSWSTYKWCNGSDRTLTKYNQNNSRGVVDDKTTLELSDDVAHVKWGENWRMPTNTEMLELLRNCTWTWYDTDNLEYGGVAGYKVTSNKPGYTHRFIFLPATGYYSDNALSDDYNYYLSSSLNSGERSYIMSFGNNNYTSTMLRSFGLSVRPVYPSETWWDDASLSLNTNQVFLLIGETINLVALLERGDDVFNYPVMWSTNNPSIASVSEDGLVNGINSGTAVITAVCHGKSVSCTVNVDLNSVIVLYPEPEYVDLGLSVKWGTCNLGASNPEEYGAYFAWGETETKSSYTWATYQWSNGTSDYITKYCSMSTYGSSSFTDNKFILDLEDDVANVKLGGDWRMPTMSEMNELYNKCTWTWFDADNLEFGGVAGYKVTSNIEGYTDHFIFLPAAGYRGGNGEFHSVGSYGYYWSSYNYTSNPKYAKHVYFKSSYVYSPNSNTSRILGLSVRPVCP